MNVDWTFFARVLPERVPLTFEVKGTELHAITFGVKIAVQHIFIDRGQLTCRLSIVEGNPDIYLVRNLLDQHLRAFLDFFGYQQGLSFDLDIISATSNSGEITNFGIGIPGLMDAHGAKPGTHEFPGELLSAAVRDSGSRTALAQFRKAMREATSTGFYCYQGIEAMMQATRQNKDKNKDKEDWDRFRLLLKIDRSAIDFVKLHADDRRHGRTSSITDAERLKVFLITDKILERYLKLNRRENRTERHRFSDP